MSPVLVNPSRFTVVSAATYQQVLDTLNVIGDWKLDDTSGTTAAATVGGAGAYPTTGVTYSATRLVQDGGTAITVDGNTGEIRCPTSAAFGTAGAIGFWFSTTDALLVRDDVSSGAGWLLASNGANVSVRANASSSRSTPLASTAVNDGNRHFAVLSTDGSTCTVFIDGSQIDSFAAAFAISTIHSPVHFGRSGTGTGTANFFAGTYDRITFFGANLSGTDVTNLWNAGK